MSLIPKKKVEIEEEKEENIYANFENQNTDVEESNNDSEINNNDVQSETQNNTQNVVQEEPQGYKYVEKEYPNDSLEKNTKVTNSSKASRGILIGFYAIVLVLGVLAFLMIRANKYEFYVKNDEVFIGAGSSYQVELIPKDARYFDYLNYDYTIADESVAMVDEFGTVTTKKPGSTTLKISLSPGFNSKTMRIVSEDINVESVDVRVFKEDKLQAADVLNVNVDQSVTIKAIVNGSEEVNANAKYTSSDTSIVVVDEFGNVTAKGDGTAVVSAEVNGVIDIITFNVKKKAAPVVTPAPTQRPTNVPTQKPVVTPKPTVAPTQKPGTTPNNITPRPTAVPTATPYVTAKPTATVKPTTVKVTKIDIGIASQTTKYVGDALQLSPSVEPSNATGYTVNWTSSNPSVASVNAKGLVICLKAGTAIIKAEVNGISSSSTLIVKNKVTATATPKPTTVPTAAPTSVPVPSGTQFASSSIQLDKTSITVGKGQTATFKVTVTKATGTIKVTSSDSSVAKVTLPLGDPDVPSCNQSQGICFLDGFTGSDSLSFTVTGVKAGTAYINVVIDDIQTSGDKAVTGTGKVGILVQ